MSLLAENPSLAIAAMIALGIGAQWLAWRIKIPAILLLLITGFAVGPLTGILKPSDFIDNELLFPIISLAVALILFEGGLTLHLSEVEELHVVVRRLVSFGALITWLGATLGGFLIMKLDLNLAALFGALVIVTGPTVIGPLLRNVKPQKNIGLILKWEGILIDPIGAVIAVLVFEFILIGSRFEALGQILVNLIWVVTVGGISGVIGGVLLAFILRRNLLPDYLTNVVSLAMVLALFAAANALAQESGLLTTTLMGIIVANQRLPGLRGLLNFKENLSLLFISLLFIILAANIELETFLEALSWRSLLLVAFLIVIVRPLSVFVSTLRSGLGIQERLFLSWIAPRGIVAASVTSLFVFELSHAGTHSATVLEPLVFTIIVTTVTLASLSAKPLARLLGVAEPDPKGFLILGAHPVARHIAAFLKKEGVAVTLADINWSNVSDARLQGIDTYYGNLLSDQSDDELQLAGIGNLLALTPNDEANALTSLKYAHEFGSQHVFQLEPKLAGTKRQGLSEEQAGRILFHHGTTYEQLERLFQSGGRLKKTDLTPQFTLEDFEALYGPDYISLFIIRNGDTEILRVGSNPPDVGTTLISMVLEREEEPDGRQESSL
ncbi:MAG: sodium:proton antiporter [Trueperaceae bacterium]|nr:MAG: sodium:proton antiporter [Trueperaceae bacterium]